MNLIIENVRRVGHDFKSFHNYQLRLILHRGVDWPAQPSHGSGPHPRRRHPDQLVA